MIAHAHLQHRMRHEIDFCCEGTRERERDSPFPRRCIFTYNVTVSVQRCVCRKIFKTSYDPRLCFGFRFQWRNAKHCFIVYIWRYRWYYLDHFRWALLSLPCCSFANQNGVVDSVYVARARGDDQIAKRVQNDKLSTGTYVRFGVRCRRLRSTLNIRKYNNFVGFHDICPYIGIGLVCVCVWACGHIS